MSTIQQTGISIGGVVEQFENVLPKSQAEVSVVQQRLHRAGFRNESAVKIFYGCKVLVPLLLCAMALAHRAGEPEPVFRLRHGPWHGIPGAGFLAGKTDFQSAKARFGAACPMCLIFW